MPTLDLAQLHLPEAGVYLEAVMFWPRDPARHYRLVEAAQNEALRNVLNQYGADKVQADSLQQIARAAAGPRLHDVLKDAPIQITPGLVIRQDVAVKLFSFVLSCAAANDPKEPATLEHARTVLGTAGGKYASYPGLGRSELIQIWQDFSPAVHLLTARALFGGDSWDRGAEPPGTRLTNFLAVAEALRLRGERHRPARSKSHLLDERETWKAPDWVSLPDISDAALPLPTPAMLREAMAAWPHPRDVR